MKNNLLRCMAALAMTAVVAPVVALADCPDISGSYSCQFQGFQQAVNIAEAKANGVTAFQIDNGGEIYADGQPHQTNNLQSFLDTYCTNYNYTANCQAADVHVQGTADMKDGSGKANFTTDLNEQNGGLAIGINFQMPSQTVNATLNCVKQ